MEASVFQICCRLFFFSPILAKQQPLIASPTHYLFQVFLEGVTFFTCTQVEMPPLIAIELESVMPAGLPAGVCYASWPASCKSLTRVSPS
ncbi:hypothetical protein P8452_66489 [Trifolium repens]|nr:hypothetical protein P8452_66489 [Trifolium repens]